MAYNGMYWCDKCGRLMSIDYASCSNNGLVLKCLNRNEKRQPCTYRLFFLKTDPWAFYTFGGSEDDSRMVDSDDDESGVVSPDGVPELVDGGHLGKDAGSADTAAATDPHGEEVIKRNAIDTMVEAYRENLEKRWEDG